MEQNQHDSQQESKSDDGDLRIQGFVSRRNRLSKTPIVTPEVDAVTEKPKDCENGPTRHKELDPLLQSSFPLDSHTQAAPVAAYPTTHGRSSTELSQGEDLRLGGTLSILRTWWKEWVLVLLAVGILLAIIVILRLNDQQPQPNWSLGLNVNTVIAILATLLRSSLVTVVEEGGNCCK